MEFKIVEEKQWEEIKDIYFEAFPKRERKPYYSLRRSVKKKKATKTFILRHFPKEKESRIIRFVVR